uniref:Desmoplakin n=1 Tax=Sander lucioperca TaxID=283035 RepID=A0A8C9Y9L3_SANLU
MILEMYECIFCFLRSGFVHLPECFVYVLQGSAPNEAERYMMKAKDIIEQLKACAMDLRDLGQPNDNVVRTLEICKDQLKGVHMAISGTMHRRRSTRGGSGGWEEPGKSYQDAMAWIAQQKRLIETASWGDDPAAIKQQLSSHQNFHSSIQRASEVERAKGDLVGSGNIHALDQEWDSLQQMSIGRIEQLQELKSVIQDMSKEIMWVNDREEEELMFDWGDKNIDQYIPQKQESYSKLMSALEDKEKDLNKLTARVDALLKNNHPASDKIEAYKDTLQTQWSWLLQITKCIDIHLKENAAYSQFFKEANETYSILQKEHETVRKRFTCDKNTPLENLVELLKGLEREKEKIMENKRQVQHLVSKSRSIVRLKPRNPEEKSSNPTIVKALCDFKQDQKVICKGNEAILKDNSQRSKWNVTGPGGLDMLVPSVCLIVPPPNPLSISLANKNEQYYEAILQIWSQLYINVKSLIAWQYCLLDIRKINSLTISVLSSMRPEEYRQLIKSLETHYEEFRVNSHGSQMFTDDDKRGMESQFNGAQDHYEQIVVQLPTYMEQKKRVKEVKVVTKEIKTVEVPRTSSRSLSELHALRLRLEGAEGSLSQHVHICLGDNEMHDCGLKISQLETVQRDVDSMRQEYLRLRESISKELEGMSDSDKAQFLRSEIGVIDQRLASLESSSSAYLQRLQALRDMLECVAQAEDIVKVHEARLTEKETTSLSPSEVEDYTLTLKNIKAELDQKKDVLASMEAALAKASHWNGQVSGPFHRCDMMLSKYTEEVGLLSDRWRRLQGQIDTRVLDLQLYHPQLQTYKQTSSSLIDWIDATRKKQDTLQTTKIESIQALTDHINKQKALNSEIIERRETVESVLKDNEACVNSIKDYETDLASYTSGLETLLNIPIKRTMLKSPSTDLNLEATQLQTRYMELLAHSGDYYKFLGELLKNMEELKIRNTRIDLLEEELRLLRENMQDRDAKNKSLEDAVSRYKLELSSVQNQMLSIEEVKQSTTLQCNATKDRLDTTKSQLADLNDEVTRLNYLLEEEKRKRRLAEERYTTQQEEYELVLRKRQKELETISRSKVEVEKSELNKEQEIQQLRRQLAEDGERIKDLQKEMSKTSAMMQSIQSQHSEIVNERDALLLKLQLSEKDKDRYIRLEEELSRIKLSQDSELRNKQRLQEEIERMKRDVGYWKDQYESKEGLIRQYDIDKERLEREKNSLKSEIERLMRELRELDEIYKSRLSTMQKELQEVAIVKRTMETELTRTEPQASLQLFTGLLLLPEPKKPITVQGLRGQVSVIDLVDANLLDRSDMDNLREGRLTSQDIEDRLRSYLRGSTCIAGVYDEDSAKVISIYQAMKNGLLRPGTTLELLEAQAASGFIVDPVNNQYLTVSDAYNKRLFGPEFKDSLLSAERAVTGYKLPGTDKIISHFEAIERGLVEKGHGMRLLEAQIASGGIIDPEHSHRIDVNVAYKRGYFDKKMNSILTDENVNTKGFFDPNTEENLTYLELKKRCITDKKTGLILLLIMNKKKLESTLKNTMRKRRVVIVDPDTNKEMTVREAYDKGFIDYETFVELSGQECEWEEITITAPDGSTRFVIIDRKTGRQYDITELLETRVINQSDLDKYQSRTITLNQFADIIRNKTKHETSSSSLTDILIRSATTSSLAQDSTDSLRNISSVSVNLASPVEAVGEQEPVGAIFDTDTLEKITITEALNRGLVDSITAQRLLEAQVCTGGLINPKNGHRLSIQEATRLGIINDDMAPKLKPAQKAFFGFEDIKNRKKMSAAQAMKESWLPYEAGHRFLEFQFVTGGLYDPEMGCRRSIEDAVKMGWMDVKAGQKLQDIRHHTKNLTCPKTKLKISYKEALDNCLEEESNGLKMLQASSVSSRGISSPYNFASGPGSNAGSRSGSRQGSRRSSVDLGSTSSSALQSHTSLTTFYASSTK